MRLLYCRAPQSFKMQLTEKGGQEDGIPFSVSQEMKLRDAWEYRPRGAKAVGVQQRHALREWGTRELLGGWNQAAKPPSSGAPKARDKPAQGRASFASAALGPRREREARTRGIAGCQNKKKRRSQTWLAGRRSLWDRASLNHHTLLCRGFALFIVRPKPRAALAKLARPWAGLSRALGATENGTTQTAMLVT